MGGGGAFGVNGELRESNSVMVILGQMGRLGASGKHVAIEGFNCPIRFL